MYSFAWAALTNPRLECFEAHDDDGGGSVSGMRINCFFHETDIEYVKFFNI